MPFDCSTDAAGTCVAMPSSKVNDTMVCALALEALEAEQRRTTKSVARMTRPAHAQRAIGRRTVAMRGGPFLGGGRLAAAYESFAGQGNGKVPKPATEIHTSA